MQKIVLASQSNLKIGSLLLRLGQSQLTKTTQRQCSTILMRPQESKNKKLYGPIINSSFNSTAIYQSGFDTSRTFATSHSWQKSETTSVVDEGTNTTEAIKDVDLSAYNNTGYIPEPPPIMDESVIMNAIGEPTLQSLGLASNFTPVGWTQQIIEFFHVSLGLPWYTSIVLFGVLMRTCLFPITVKSQQNAAKMKKIAPLTNRLKEKINEAKISGDSLKVARATNEYSVLMRSHNIGLGALGLPVLQIPIFISAFIGIRKMCNLPVESMATGGTFWFENLTIADPTYILPTLSVLSILAVVYRGIETGIELKNMTPMMKVAVFALSGISFPFLIFMPAGIMVYFVTTNAISLGLSFVMNAKAVKKALNIPIMTANEQREVKMAGKKEKNFISGFMESIQNQKIISEVKEREALRHRQFERAGTQVPKKTYKNNPKAK